MLIEITTPSGNKLYYTGKGGRDYMTSDLDSAFNYEGECESQLSIERFQRILGSMFKVRIIA